MKKRYLALFALFCMTLSACGKKTEAATTQQPEETVTVVEEEPRAQRIAGPLTEWTTIIDHYTKPYEDTIDPLKNGYLYGDYTGMVLKKTENIYSKLGKPVYNEASRNTTNSYILLNTQDETHTVCDMEMGFTYQFDFTQEDGSIISKTMLYNPVSNTLFCQTDCEIDTVLKNMLEDYVPTGYKIESFSTKTGDKVLNSAFDDNLYVIGDYGAFVPEPVLDFICAVNTDTDSSLLYGGDIPENILFSIEFSLDPKIFDLDVPAKDFTYVYNPEIFSSKIDLILSGYGEPVRWYDNKDEVQKASDIRITRTYAIRSISDYMVAWETNPDEVNTPVFCERHYVEPAPIAAPKDSLTARVPGYNTKLTAINDAYGPNKSYLRAGNYDDQIEGAMSYAFYLHPEWTMIGVDTENIKDNDKWGTYIYLADGEAIGPYGAYIYEVQFEEGISSIFVDVDNGRTMEFQSMYLENVLKNWLAPYYPEGCATFTLDSHDGLWNTNPTGHGYKTILVDPQCQFGSILDFIASVSKDKDNTLIKGYTGDNAFRIRMTKSPEAGWGSADELKNLLNSYFKVKQEKQDGDAWTINFSVK